MYFGAGKYIWYNGGCSSHFSASSFVEPDAFDNFCIAHLPLQYKRNTKKARKKLRKLDDTNGRLKAIPSSSTTDADDDKYWMMISSNIKNTKKRERDLEN